MIRTALLLAFALACNAALAAPGETVSTNGLANARNRCVLAGMAADVQASRTFPDTYEVTCVAKPALPPAVLLSRFREILDIKRCASASMDARIEIVEGRRVRVVCIATGAAP